MKVCLSESGALGVKEQKILKAFTCGRAFTCANNCKLNMNN